MTKALWPNGGRKGGDSNPRRLQKQALEERCLEFIESEGRVPRPKGLGGQYLSEDIILSLAANAMLRRG